MINEDMRMSLLRMSILSATDLYCKNMLNYLSFVYKFDLLNTPIGKCSVNKICLLNELLSLAQKSTAYEIRHSSPTLFNKH